MIGVDVVIHTELRGPSLFQDHLPVSPSPTSMVSTTSPGRHGAAEDIDADLLRLANLTLSEYMVLMVLSEAPGRSRRMNELADQVLISVSGLSRLIERLEREAWSIG